MVLSPRDFFASSLPATLTMFPLRSSVPHGVHGTIGIRLLACALNVHSPYIKL